MRFLCLAWLLFFPLFFSNVTAQGANVPPLKGRVNDYGAMVSQQAREALDRKLATIEAEESTQIVILTVPSLEGEPIEEFSIRVAEAWKIGREAEDNGVILIVSKQDRSARIEVGSGLEGRLTDLQAGRIIRNELAPAFAAGRFDEGFAAAADAIIASVKGEYQGGGAKRQEKRDKPSLPLVIFMLIILFIYMRMQRVRRHHAPMLFGGPGGSGWGAGGFGGGSFGGGGGFSGGGGGFGGGGASGNW